MERDLARGAIQPGLKFLARYSQTGLGFSARPNGPENLKKSLVIKRNFSRAEKGTPACAQTVLLHLSKNFSRRFAFSARAEIENVITTIFHPGGRSEISARAETHHVIRPLVT